MANSTNDPHQSDPDQGLSSTPPSDSPAPNDELLREAGGGSFGSIFSDIADFVVHSTPFVADISDGVEQIITGKSHMENKMETIINQTVIAEAAGDTSVGSQIAREFLPQTYDEVQKKYVNKELNDAFLDDQMS